MRPPLRVRKLMSACRYLRQVHNATPYGEERRLISQTEAWLSMRRCELMIEIGWFS